MPTSKKRHGHSQQKTAEVPASQRTSGHFFWAILFGVFGLLIALFASEGDIFILVSGAILGGAAGWFLGTKMERDSKT